MELQIVELWPAQVPWEQGDIGTERDITQESDGLVAGKRVSRIGNVSRPTLSVYLPSIGQNSGAAMVVFLGGGYSILALDLEGTEVCRWLNSIVVTAILVKYRVPSREGLEKHTAALQEAQRAMSLVRNNAKEWGIDESRIGVLGFSAGAHLCTCTDLYDGIRSFSKIDDLDSRSFRPNFTVLIYPGYLTVKEENGDEVVAPELAVSSNRLPTFIIATQDDPLVKVEGALCYSVALQKANVPFELHIYRTGGHGFGLRKTGVTATTWPSRLADWMRSCGWL